jgi:hypothetical protein
MKWIAMPILYSGKVLNSNAGWCGRLYVSGVCIAKWIASGL